MKTSIRNTRRAFTLIELIVSLSLMGFVSIGIYQFILNSGQVLFISTEKLEINADIRAFTLEMNEFARAANHFFIYPSFNSADRNDVADRQRDGMTGDFLLLVFQEPYPNQGDPEHITRLIGYFRMAEEGNEGPVYKFDVRYPQTAYPSTLTNTPESLIANLTPDMQYQRVIELSRGLANQQLFYNFYDRSIMIKAEIIHGNEAKRVTDTYNFTVSPRG
jgi:prepilin-type N-terminal cleavage/methylation domain-containing protein